MAGSPTVDTLPLRCQMLRRQSPLRFDRPTHAVGARQFDRFDQAVQVLGVQWSIAGQAVQHAYLGVSLQNAASGNGAELGRVTAGSPADDAGLQAGDVVTGFDGTSITNAEELSSAVAGKQPGDQVTVTYKRDGQTKTVKVTLGTRPS